VITEIVSHVEENIIGRVANKIIERRTDNTEVLLEFVMKAEGGNHLEIGTLFGGSAISVALLKDSIPQDGFVFCIDPLDGYYTKYASREDMVDTQSKVAVTPETLFKNIKSFGVGHRIFVMQEYSDRVNELAGMRFSTAFIDGDHQGETPMEDWLRVKDHVTQYVIFDNCANTHPDVVRACMAAADDPEWECVYDNDITFVVGRV